MISYLEGKIISTNRNPLTILTGQVGYLVHVLPRMMQKIQPGSSQSLFIYTSVKDDAIDLFGFNSEAELDLFTILIGVSGIGPKTALLVVDRGVDPVKNAIISSDVDFFQTIPRLGKKNAQKVIIELKSKIGSSQDLDLTEGATNETKELLDALVSMGFARNEAIQTIKRLDGTEMNLEERLRKSLKYIGKPIK
jgi:holliday junction DNA helicase RuvA